MENLKDSLDKVFADQNRQVVETFFESYSVAQHEQDRQQAANNLERGLIVNNHARGTALAVIEKLNSHREPSAS